VTSIGRGRAARARARTGPLACLVAIFTVAVLLQPSAAAAYVLEGRGKQGATKTGPVVCKFGNFRTYGLLTLAGNPPRVTGAPSRRGREFVRYRAYIVNMSEQVVERTNWSGWLRVRDNRYRTWSGLTQLSADWRGNYYLDYRIEWWTNTRKIGLRDLRLHPYYYYTEHNEGPIGPFNSCARQPV
jgi:hypothetical protein